MNFIKWREAQALLIEATSESRECGLGANIDLKYDLKSLLYIR
jgi:hypothetical protein